MKKELEPFAIYLFQEGDTLYGISRVKLEGIDENYGQAFKLEEDPNSKLNSENQIRRRARRSIVASLSNLLNAVLLYGKSILDEEGNVSWEKFQQEEYKAAKKALEFSTTLDKMREVKSFKVLEISLEVAKKNNLI